MRPMLASQGTTVPRGPAWAHEIKWDGMRVLADVREGRLTLASRNENDVTASFPELGGLGALFADMLLDGEVVALDGGVPSFGALAERMHVHDARRAAALVGHQAGHLHGLRPAAPVRRRPHPPPAGRAARHPGAAGPAGPVLAGATDVRRRARAAGGDRSSRGSRAW